MKVSFEKSKENYQQIANLEYIAMTKKAQITGF